MSESYTGQLIGGPDDGNFVTATVTRFWCEVTYSEWLDGANPEPAETTVCGWYVWDADAGCFHWHLVKVGA